jgi:hypothetical protein
LFDTLLLLNFSEAIHFLYGMTMGSACLELIGDLTPHFPSYVAIMTVR